MSLKKRLITLSSESTNLQILITGPEYQKMEYRTNLRWGCICKNMHICRDYHQPGYGMDWINPHIQSRICIHNPVQSRRIWSGLDQEFINSTDSGLDWIEKCVMSGDVYPIFKDLNQFLLMVTLTSEVLNPQIFCYIHPRSFLMYILPDIW